jgi:hypothetical protein
MRHPFPFVCAAIALVSSVGCAHNSVNASADQQGQAFLAAMKALPFNQRQEYVQAHPEGVNAVMKSRDKQLLVAYNTALHSPH